MESLSVNGDFWERLDARLASYDLLAHPFYKAWSKGELTREELALYAAEYYQQVSAFPTYLSALHSKLPDGELRREVLRNLSDEEGTDTAHSRPHSELWMDFANGMGASRSDVLAHQSQPEMQELIATFRDMMTKPAVEALAALYAYESRVPAIAATKAAGLTNCYGVDARTSRYFTLHQTADVHHAQVWRGLIERELASDAAAEDAALAAAERAARALWAALDGVERTRLN